MVRGIKVQFTNRYAESRLSEAAEQGGASNYDYKCALDVAVGDCVVVESSAGMTVAEVTGIRDTPINKATKWAFQRVDIATLQLLQRAEQERGALADALRKKLIARKEIEIYNDLAANDPEAKAMLDRMMEIDRSFANVALPIA